MSEDKAKKRLGRGLAALIGDIEVPQSSPNISSHPITSEKQVPIELVSRNPRNPRRIFVESDLEDLAQSIREHGIVQPLVVRPSGGEHYELIAGERRWRAAQQAGLFQVPVIIRDVDDRTALELAIIENVQRSDLNPVEEALGYQQLIDEHGYTQADLANVIAKSRSHVANTLRLLKLPPLVQQMVNDGLLSAGHARCLVTAVDPLYIAQKIIDEGLSVRQAEALSAKPIEDKKTVKTAIEKDADTKILERRLGDTLGLKVDIKYNKKGGDLRISYKTLEQLDDLCKRLGTQIA